MPSLPWRLDCGPGANSGQIQTDTMDCGFVRAGGSADGSDVDCEGNG